MASQPINPSNINPNMAITAGGGLGTGFFMAEKLTSNLIIRATVRFMEPAFAFQTVEAGFLGGLAGRARGTAVGIANGHIALVPKRVVGKVVLRQILINIALAPVQNGMDFIGAFLELQDVELTAGARLHAAQARTPNYQAHVRIAANVFPSSRPLNW